MMHVEKEHRKVGLTRDNVWKPHQPFVFHRHTNSLFSTAMPTACSQPPCQQIVLYRHANSLFSTAMPTACSPPPCQQLVLHRHANNWFSSATPTIFLPPPHQQIVLNHQINNSELSIITILPHIPHLFFSILINIELKTKLTIAVLARDMDDCIKLSFPEKWHLKIQFFT